MVVRTDELRANGAPAAAVLTPLAGTSAPGRARPPRPRPHALPRPGAPARVVRPSPVAPVAAAGLDPVEPASAPARSASSHRADIQGLRAVAVLLVVLAHAGVGFLAGGFVGVDVFFVLSGFLITGLLLAEARANGSVSMLEFYVRRARRILPAAALTLLVTNVAAVLLLNFVRARDAVHDSLGAAAFSANFRFAERGVDYFAQADPPSPVLHYWSLSVEEQFYVVWPLLLSVALFGLAVRRRRGGHGHERRLLVVVLVLTAASLAWSIHLTATAPTIAYFSPFTRAWELGLGATIAVCASMLARPPAAARIFMGWAGVAAIAVAAVVFSERTPFPGSAALLPTVGTALVIVAGTGGRTPRLAVAQLLALRPMRLVGDRSYAFYLWHWPVLILADAYAGHELSVPVKLGLMSGAFLLSCASYALVENPIRRRVRSRRATAVVVAVSTAAFLGTATLALAGVDRAQQRFERPSGAGASISTLGFRSSAAKTAAKGALPAVVAAVQAARRGAPIPTGLTPPLDELKGLPPEYAPRPECIGHDRSSRSTTAVCRMGDRASRKLIVLLGDSHAMMWLPSVLETARRDHWAVVPLLRLGCTPGKWTGSSGSAACRAWYRWALAEIGRLDPRVTLIGGSIDERQAPATRAAIEGVVAAAQALRARGNAVVIGDPEGLDRDPVDCVLSRGATMATCTTTWPARSIAAYDEVARRVTRLGAGFLRTRGFVCFERRCPAVIGNTIAWVDTNHLSAAYSSGIARAFQAAFLRAIPKRRP
jgi:peptidoglycan/LPS O-acetylase OafA/YrhL